MSRDNVQFGTLEGGLGLPTSRQSEVSGKDYRDLVIEELAASEAELREQNTMLINMIVNLAFDNFMLRRVFERELFERIHADGALARTRRTLRERRQLSHNAAV